MSNPGGDKYSHIFSKKKEVDLVGKNNAHDIKTKKECEKDKEFFPSNERDLNEEYIDIINLLFHELEKRYKNKLYEIIDGGCENIAVIDKSKYLEEFRVKYKVEFYNLKHDLSNIPKGNYSGKDVFSSDGYFSPYKQFND